jgi:predicted ribosomally synthesized peptide with SipW-like signal peptide
MRRAVLPIGAAVATALAAAVLGSTGGATYAAFSDFHVIKNNQVGAGVWAPDPPAACGPLVNYEHVIYGTPGNDNFYGGNRPQIIMGYGGDDTIHAGNSGDCLVGGEGVDHLYGGNGKDILIGGAGDDLLDGGNAKDWLDGDLGNDTCIGGNGNDTIVNCEITP